MKNSIANIVEQYENFSNESANISSSISNNISMLDLESVNEGIAEAIMTIEGITNKGEEKTSVLKRLPFFGKYISEGKEKIDQHQIKTGKMTEVVDRLFKALSDKKDNIENIADTLFELQDKLIQESRLLEQHEVAAQDIIENGEPAEAFRAKNLLAQVQQSILKTNDRIDVIKTTTMAAAESTQQISTLLPSLKGEIIAELSIQSGLEQLREFKQTFDTTIAVAEDLSAVNNASMKSVLLDVVDLSVTNTQDVARLQNVEADRQNFRQQLDNKMKQATAKRDKALDTLQEIRTDNMLADNSAAATFGVRD